MVRAHLHVQGIVQGVNFRASTLHEARMLRVRGWVRNCPDGGVEMIAEGEKEPVEKLVSWCRHGPCGARVKRVEVCWEEPLHQDEGFHIRY